MIYVIGPSPQSVVITLNQLQAADISYSLRFLSGDIRSFYCVALPYLQTALPELATEKILLQLRQAYWIFPAASVSARDSSSISTSKMAAL